MALDKPYIDIPGTIIFDADMASIGFHLNQFCISLMEADNRERFKADQRAYLDEWAMSEEQKQAVLDRDYNRMIALGGNIYFLAKIFSTDHISFQSAAASMTGMTQEEYAQMMLDGGRSPEGQRYDPEKAAKAVAQKTAQAKITAGVTTSHVPAIVAAIDLGESQTPYWQPLFAGYEYSKQWIAEQKPDVIVLLYNDHATAFSLDLIPTFMMSHSFWDPYNTDHMNTTRFVLECRMTVVATLDRQGNVQRAAILRTARKLFDGFVFAH